MAKFRIEGTNFVTELKETEKEKRIKELRAEASRKASLANKRIARLEKAGLTDTPAYKHYIESGGVKFSVRGKSYNDVQKELARLNNFINQQSSTIRGVNSTLKEMAKNTGIKYKNLNELREKSSKFFELSSKVEQYLRTVEDMASAVGYQKIWEAINTYTKEAKVDLQSSENNIDDMVEKVTKAIKEYEDPLKDKVNVTNESFNWFMLKE